MKKAMLVVFMAMCVAGMVQAQEKPADALQQAAFGWLWPR